MKLYKVTLFQNVAGGNFDSVWWRKTKEAVEALAQDLMDDENIEMLDQPEVTEVEVPMDEKGFAGYLNENAYCDQHTGVINNKKTTQLK